MDQVLIDPDEYESLRLSEKLLNEICSVAYNDGLDYAEQGKMIRNILDRW